MSEHVNHKADNHAITVTEMQQMVIVPYVINGNRSSKLVIVTVIKWEKPVVIFEANGGKIYVTVVITAIISYCYTPPGLNITYMCKAQHEVIYLSKSACV